jgi:hypothetical protein
VGARRANNASAVIESESQLPRDRGRLRHAAAKDVKNRSGAHRICFDIDPMHDSRGVNELQLTVCVYVRGWTASRPEIEDKPHGEPHPDLVDLETDKWRQDHLGKDTVAWLPQSSAMSPGGEDLAGCNPSAALRADREEDYSAFRKRTSLRRHDSFTLGSFGRSCRPCLRGSVSVRLANDGGFGGWPPYMAASIASRGEFNLMPQGPGRIQAAMREGSEMSLNGLSAAGSERSGVERNPAFAAVACCPATRVRTSTRHQWRPVRASAPIVAVPP